VARKFYKTIIQIEILSEDEPYPDGNSLADIDYDITDGKYSGAMKIVGSVELDGATAANALKEQGSSPYFFQIDDDGNEITL
jgi:hypothetical protein